jgi:hypothetical protein
MLEYYTLSVGLVQELQSLLNSMAIVQNGWAVEVQDQLELAESLEEHLDCGGKECTEMRNATIVKDK